MKNYLNQIFSDQPARLHRKVIYVYSLLIAYNSIVWFWAFYVFSDHPLLFSTAVLAFTFGLRHAVDVDHIAAIDNVTRKLLQEGKHPISVGLFFSLGHSTVVIIASILIAIATSALMQRNMANWHEIGSVITTLASALFLLLIGVINLITFISLAQVFRQVRFGKNYSEQQIEKLIDNRGFLARRFRFLFKLITHSWQMYFVGFLFGIGFDTATEVALLGITASQTLKGLSLWSILIFPALFTAGMTLIDTTDGVLMLGAYNWAFLKPIRKLYYNLTITFMSVFVALFIGSIEALGLLSDKLELEGPFWNFIKLLNSHNNSLGYLIIISFIACWVISIAIYKLMGFEKNSG
jgi:high-affinity nickel-transport protein